MWDVIHTVRWNIAILCTLPILLPAIHVLNARWCRMHAADVLDIVQPLSWRSPSSRCSIHDSLIPNMSVFTARLLRRAQLLIPWYVVCPSVTLSYRDHIDWSNISKIISRLSRLRFLHGLTQHAGRSGPTKTTPKLGWNMDGPGAQKPAIYLRNDAR